MTTFQRLLFRTRLLAAAVRRAYWGMCGVFTPSCRKGIVVGAVRTCRGGPSQPPMGVSPSGRSLRGLRVSVSLGDAGKIQPTHCPKASALATQARGGHATPFRCDRGTAAARGSGADG